MNRQEKAGQRADWASEEAITAVEDTSFAFTDILAVLGHHFINIQDNAEEWALFMAGQWEPTTFISSRG